MVRFVAVVLLLWLANDLAYERGRRDGQAAGWLRGYNLGSFDHNRRITEQNWKNGCCDVPSLNRVRTRGGLYDKSTKEVIRSD